MTLVADASLLLALYLGEPAAPEARALLEAEAVIAPEFVLGEVTNGLWRACRMRRLSAADARLLLPTVPSLFQRLVGMEELAELALDLALRRNHPAYDCFYVALAMQEGAPLATADRRLAERFAGDAAIHPLPG